MRWKYCLPEPWNEHEDRIALEDVFLMNEQIQGESYWLTLEALQSRTGGTREEKMARLGDREFVIDEPLEMLIRRENFDRDELLFWTKEFIRSKLGDADPVLLEAEPTEFEGAHPVTRATRVFAPSTRPTRFLFVFHEERLHAPTPDSLVEHPLRVEVRTAGALEGQPHSLPAKDLEWADIIVVLEKRIRSLVHKRCKALGLTKRLICLYMPEHITVADPTYAAAFRSRFRFYLQRLGL